MSKAARDAFYAGLLAANGWIGYHRRKLKVTITSKDPLIVAGLEHHFGKGRITTFTPQARPDLLIYSWQLEGGVAVSMLERCLPHLTGAMHTAVSDALAAERERQELACKP